MIGDVKKFSLAEMTSNNNGKTSASGVMGSIICMVGTLCFLAGVIGLMLKIITSSDILTQSIAIIYAGALLLGYRKSTDKAEIENGVSTDPDATPEDPAPEQNSSQPDTTSTKPTDTQINS